MSRVAWNNARYVAQIVAVHTNDILEFIIVDRCYLPRAFAAVEGNARRTQRPSGRRIYGVADFLTRGRRRFGIELPRDASLVTHIFKYKLRHRTAANIPVADE